MFFSSRVLLLAGWLCSIAVAGLREERQNNPFFCQVALAVFAGHFSKFEQARHPQLSKFLHNAYEISNGVTEFMGEPGGGEVLKRGYPDYFQILLVKGDPSRPMAKGDLQNILAFEFRNEEKEGVFIYISIPKGFYEALLSGRSSEIAAISSLEPFGRPNKHSVEYRAKNFDAAEQLSAMIIKAMETSNPTWAFKIDVPPNVGP